jgi:outer membrane immunogenic protein
MIKILSSAAAIALTLSIGPALAADLPSRKGPPPIYVPPPPPPMWTGFYLGLNAGGTFGGSNSVITSGGPLGLINGPWPVWCVPYYTNVNNAFGLAANSVNPVSNGGFIGGGQAGYNYQFNNAFVVGLEADIQGIAGSSGSSSVSGFSPMAVPSYALANNVASTATASKSLDYLGTVRGRIGYLINPTLLVYGTGGLAYGGANLNTSIFASDTANVFQPTFGGSSYSSTLVGWTAGGGLEWMFMPNWSAKLEYLYYDLGTVTTPGSMSAVSYNSYTDGYGAFHSSAQFAAIAQQTSAHFNGHIVRAGVNYHFNWWGGEPAPILAKY